MENLSIPNWSRYHLAAAGLSAFTCLVHIFAGGPEIYAAVRNSPLDPMLRSVLSVIWHFCTVLFALMALALIDVARRPNPALELMVLGTCLATVALFIGYGFADLGNVTQMPQWTLFLSIAALMVIGQWRR